MCKPLQNNMERVGKWLIHSEHSFAFTGAGVSTDSGIPDFRGNDGLWKDQDPMKVASRKALKDNPQTFFKFWTDRFSQLDEAPPNITHEVLAALEASGFLNGVVTQNIDGLHAEAGSGHVIRLHGNFQVSRCEGCGREVPTDIVLQRFRNQGVPRCENCGELIRPDVVLFNEQLPADEVKVANEELARAELLLVLGTSLGVYPAASLVPHFKDTEGKLVIINKEPTPYDNTADLVHHGDLAPTMKVLEDEMGL